MAESIPSSCTYLIIGGGIIGCSVAYHLAKFGAKDIVVLERHQLTSGSTFHAAGLVGQLRSSANITQLLKQSVELYESLEKETGIATGWKKNGGLRLACNKDRLIELKRQATTAHSFGLEMEILTPEETKNLWPLLDNKDIIASAFLPTDGQANPSDLTQSLSKGAKLQGVKFIEHCQVLELIKKHNRITEVKTTLGNIQCETIINCAGIWANKIGQLADVITPIVPVKHQYLITDKIKGVESTLPTLRDPDNLTYFKEEVGGLVMGGYEKNPIPFENPTVPEEFNFRLFDGNWDHFEPLMTSAINRVPALEHAGVVDLINGLEAFTPDGNFILGPAPNLDNFFMACGFNAFGIASAGGAGRALAIWVLQGYPEMDLWPVDCRRFHLHHNDVQWVKNRTLELYGKHYSIAWPFEEHESARGKRTSALYPILQNANACFGEKLGWERPNWFADKKENAIDQYDFARGNWFDAVKKEHFAVRKHVALFDQSSFAKFRFIGKDAEKILSYIAANDVCQAPGSIIYTQMCNQKGGIECDLTLSRISEEEYYIVTGTGFATHDACWIKSQIPTNANIEFIEVSEKFATLALMGPKARSVLQKVTDDDISNSALPFATFKEINIGKIKLKALRLTFVGELGYELHIAREHVKEIYEKIMAAGQEHQIQNAGYRAIESCRLEKAYRVWGADISPDHTPIEAGLNFAVKLNKEIDFCGREALLTQKQNGVKKKLVAFTVDDPNIVLLGRESIYRNNQLVGWVTSAGFGYTINKNIAYGYIRQPEQITKEFLLDANYQLEVACQKVPAQIHLGVLYDPKMERIKC